MEALSMRKGIGSNDTELKVDEEIFDEDDKTVLQHALQTSVEMDEQLCGRCKKRPVLEDTSDALFKFFCAKCHRYLTEKTRLKWTEEKKEILSTCGTCWDDFRYTWARSRHDCTRPGVYCCQHCRTERRTAYGIVRHIYKRHNEVYQSINPDGSCKLNELYFCKSCKCVLHTSVRFKAHNMYYHNESPVSCSVCEKVFYNSNSLLQHMYVHTGERRVPCHICGKTFSNKGTLKAHVNRHNGIKPYACSLCKETFFCASNCNRHMKNVHNFQRSKESFRKGKNQQGIEAICKICKICKKSYKRSSDLKDHINSHNGIKPHKCNVCGKAFGRRKDLPEHIKTHTVGWGGYRCDTCSMVFKDSSSVRRHKRHRHEQRRYHTCTVCGKSFFRAYDLKVHMRLHTDEKPFSCHLCQARYTASSNLKSHISKKHLNTKNKLKILGANLEAETLNH